MMNGMNKIRGREKPTKRAGTRGQVMVKIQLEIVEVEKSSLYLHRFSLHCALFWNVTGWYNENNWTPQLVKLGLQYEAHTRKWYHMIHYFICFPVLILFHMA